MKGGPPSLATRAARVPVMLAVLIVLGTVALVVWQPRGLGAARAATLGAVVALLAGVVHLSDLPTLWGATWNATLTLVGLIVLSLLLDAAGLFRWAALHVARWGGGSGRRLLALLVGLCAVVAALYANDGGVLILTPIVLELAGALRVSRAATLTLAEWRRRFHARASEVRALGFDDRFMRTWDYYLAYCEAAFRERHIGDVQVVMTKNNNVSWMPGDPGVGTPQMFAQQMVGGR